MLTKISIIGTLISLLFTGILAFKFYAHADLQIRLYHKQRRLVERLYKVEAQKSEQVCFSRKYHKTPQDGDIYYRGFPPYGNINFYTINKITRVCIKEKCELRIKVGHDKAHGTIDFVLLMNEYGSPIECPFKGDKS